MTRSGPLEGAAGLGPRLGGEKVACSGDSRAGLPEPYLH